MITFEPGAYYYWLDAAEYAQAQELGIDVSGFDVDSKGNYYILMSSLGNEAMLALLDEEFLETYHYIKSTQGSTGM